MIDELNGGSIYRFVPDERGDLSSGQLYALKLTGLSDDEQKWSASTFEDKVGSRTASWPSTSPSARSRRSCSPG